MAQHVDHRPQRGRVHPQTSEPLDKFPHCPQSTCRRDECARLFAALDARSARCYFTPNMNRLVLLALLASGCTVSQRNAVGISTTVVSLGLDWRGTRSAATDWRGRTEGGIPAQAIMGSTPTPGVVDVYFATATVFIVALSYLVPERYRWVAYAAVTLAEAKTVYGNLSTTSIH